MRGIFSTPACDVRTAIKIANETTNNQGKKYNWVKHLQREQFSFTKTSIESEVSLKTMSYL